MPSSARHDRVNALQREASEAKAQADKAESARRQAEQQNADLQRRLQDCENSKPTVATAAQPSHFVQFDHNSSYMSRAEADRLKAFARSVRGKKLSLMAEASTPGPQRAWQETLARGRGQHTRQQRL